jgi:hypothetical protein
MNSYAPFGVVGTIVIHAALICQYVFAIFSGNLQYCFFKLAKLCILFIESRTILHLLASFQPNHRNDGEKGKHSRKRAEHHVIV